jgi:hypothetical protein
MTVCKEEMTENGLEDVGYEALDMRVVTAIKKSHWWKLQWKKKIEEIDFRNEQKKRKADLEIDYQSKHVAKKIWRHLHEPTVTLSGKSWKV